MLLPVQPVIIIGIHNRDTVLRTAGIDFAFRFRHAGQRAETFQMRHRRVIDQRRFRARQANSRRFLRGD